MMGTTFVIGYPVHVTSQASFLPSRSFETKWRAPFALEWWWSRQKPIMKRHDDSESATLLNLHRYFILMTRSWYIRVHMLWLTAEVKESARAETTSRSMHQESLNFLYCIFCMLLSRALDDSACCCTHLHGMLA